MRPQRLLPVPLIVLVLALASGCAEKAARIAGNERLLRGDDGLGTTFVRDTLVDRDTYILPATTAIRGATILVGNVGTFQARSLLRPLSWTLPADTLAVVDSIRFELEFDPRVDENLAGSRFLALHLAGAPWDTSAVEWPGPPLGTQLGTGEDATAPYRIVVTSVTHTQLRAWSRDAAFPGFILALQSGTGLRGFLAGSGRLHIYSHTNADTTIVTTTLPTDVTIHSPEVAATGTETELRLGGLFQSSVLLRAPVSLPPDGFSVNGARFVTRIVTLAARDTVEIRAYRIRNSWSENVAADTTLGLDASPFATLSSLAVNQGDSITVPVPVSMALEWARDSTTNHGILLRVTNSIYSDQIGLGSRESASPPVFRVNLTTPPPGRF